MDYQKKFELTTIMIYVKNSGRSRDSADYDVFHFSYFQGYIWDNFINSIGYTDNKEATLFSGSMETKKKFRAL